jgi:hypothetical protein
MLPLPRALPPARANSLPDGRGSTRQPYRLPHEVKDRLASSLAQFRNQKAAYALALFLGRFWSVPGRVALPFPIDRRALAGREDLKLTEAQVRGAIKTLEAVGFLDRVRILGSQYKPTRDGLHRKPIPFTFGVEFMPLFLAANRRGAATRERGSGARRTPTPATSRRPSTVDFSNSPKGRSEAITVVIMGEVAKGSAGQRVPLRTEPDSRLESALERWRLAFEASQRSS